MSRHVVVHTALGLLLGALAAAAVAAETPRLTLADLRLYQPTAEPRPGDWISFDLEPATVRPLYNGPIRLRNLTVLGDFEEIEWQTAPGAGVKTVQRVATRDVDGSTLSIFQLAFASADLRRLPPLPIHFDRFHQTAAWPFRVRPTTIPEVEVVRVNNRVQYSSHVVNIVAPYESELPFLPPGDRLFNFINVARIFYTYFTDTYEQLSMIPTRYHRKPVGGNGNVYNATEGLNMDLRDFRESRGSQILVSTLLHVRGDAIWNGHVLHETGHNWGLYFDLFDVAGVVPRVSTQCVSGGHMPLVAGPASFLNDACHMSTWEHGRLCIERDDGGWALGACETPYFYHPLQLYAMGLLPKDEVPPIYLRLRQDLPSPLEPGTRVEGPFVEVTIDDVVARYGERSGPPIPDVWRRAHIVVSPERLLSPGHLAWFNFFAKRVSDPNMTGIEGLDRVPSMEVATGGQVDVRTEIRPKDHPRIAGRFPVSYPKVGRRDLVGLVLDKDLVTRFRPGRPHVVSGLVRAPGRHETIRVELGSRVFFGRIDANRRFSVKIEPDPRERGPRGMMFALGRNGPVLGAVAPVYVE